ncbi:hypothetical protein Pan216_14380 [Planctomycetes bacterium Pan216]|uniref:Uncharacterized protein n=1 Tax=Kolteria novifilia TaxID=2527975 RepID=A0A518B0T1_9BACT|nr:hypothetical protein Pan216_14380 [Planctomycetes bacterium Pan216]
MFLVGWACGPPDIECQGDGTGEETAIQKAPSPLTPLPQGEGNKRLILPQGEGNKRLALPQGEGNKRLILPQGEGNKRLALPQGEEHE